MKKEERNKGVTLATLVITIVVLLILSGITINYGVSSGEKIFNKLIENYYRMMGVFR